MPAAWYCWKRILETWESAKWNRIFSRLQSQRQLTASLRERTLALNSRSIIAHYCDDALAAINIRAWMMRVSTHSSRKCECSPPGASLLLDPFLIHKRWAAVYKRVTFRNLWGFGAFSQCSSIVSRWWNAARLRSRRRYLGRDAARATIFP